MVTTTGRRMILAFEIIAFITAVTLGVLWIVLPDRNWEPWIVLCGSITVLAEIIRRFAPKRQRESNSTSIPSPHHTKKRDPNAMWLENNAHTADLRESLPRALRFAKQIRNPELERWIRIELYGYTKDGGMTNDDVVPEYRAVTGRWMDQYNNMLDTSHNPDLSFVNEYRFRFGVPKLEELASKQKMQNIADDRHINLIRENMGVQVTRFCFSPVEVRGVLDTIRNKLAEMVLDCIADAKNAV